MSVRPEIPASKTRPPHLGTPLLPRPRLIEALRDNLEQKMVVLAAEAGYGKTSLLLSANRGLSRPVAWYTLDETDIEPSLFGSGLVEALRVVVPEFGGDVLELLTSGPDLPTLRTRLLKALEALPDLVLVLDDLHIVDSSPAVGDLLDHLATQRPPHIHLAVATRTASSLRTLPRLLVEGNAFVLDRSALGFTPEEAAALLRHSHGLEVSPQQAEQLARHTEGWAAALQLAAIAAKARGMSALEGTPREIFDYLAVSVLEGLPGDVQEFLLRTSILAELWPDLCAAILEDGDPVQTLDTLDRGSLFVYRLNAEGTHYRYHQLFAEFLRSRLAHRGRLFVDELHRRAGRFLEDADLPDQAVRHYFAAEAYSDAERVMKPLHGDRLTARLAYVFRDLVNRLPEALQERYPWMVRCGASASRFVGDYFGALELARRAMRAAEGRDPTLWAFSAHGIAVMYANLDQYEAAITACRDALAQPEEGVELRMRDALLVVLASCYIATGNLEEARRIIPQLRYSPTAKDETRPGKGYTAPFLLGGIAAARFELSSAAEQYRRALQDARERNSLTYQSSVLADMVRVAVWSGDRTEAHALLKRAQALHEQTGERATDLELTNLAGDVALLAGDLDAAARQYRQALAKWHEGESQIPRVWALLGLGRVARARGAFSDAGSFLSGTEQIADRIGYRLTLPHVCLEQIGLLCEARRPEAAVAPLENARGLLTAWESRPGLARCAFLEARVYGDPSSTARTPSRGRSALADAMTRAAETIDDVLPFLRAEAAWTVPLLVDALRDPELRLPAIRLLGRIGDPRTRRPLTRLLQIHDPTVRREAEDALRLLRQPEPVALRVFLFGGFEVFRGETPIADSEWKTQKVRTLFKYLLLHRGRAVHEEQLIELLWPQSDPRAGATSLKTAVKTLREALEPLMEGSRSWFVLRQGRQLRFNPEARCWVDVTEYGTVLDQARRRECDGANDETVSLYERAVALYRGDLLEEDRYEDWTAEPRERLRETQIEALSSLGRLYAARRDHRRAVETIESVLTLDRLRETAYRDLMRYALLRSDRQRAIQAFSRCAQVLREELGVEPLPETVALYKEALGTRSSSAG